MVQRWEYSTGVESEVISFSCNDSLCQFNVFVKLGPCYLFLYTAPKYNIFAVVYEMIPIFTGV